MATHTHIQTGQSDTKFGTSSKEALLAAQRYRQANRGWGDPVWIGGLFGESGDALIENLPMAGLQPGELLAVPVSSAYQLSLASNYNNMPCPAVLWPEKRNTYQ